MQQYAEWGRRKRTPAARKLVLQVMTLAAVLLGICLIARAAGHGGMVTRVNLGDPGIRPDALSVSLEEGSGVLRAEVLEVRDGALRMRVLPGQPGRGTVRITDAGGRVFTRSFEVTPDRTLLDLETRNFAGDTVLMGSITAFYLGTALLMIRSFRSLKGSAFYAYQSIYTLGFAVFCTLAGGLQLYFFVGHLIDPDVNNVLQATQAASRAGFLFMAFTFPLVLLFAVCMVVSNIALLRHGRFRVQKLLGILIGVLMAASGWLGRALFMDYSGPEHLVIVHDVAGSLYGTVYTYFECMLLSSVVCGVMAARRRPAPDRDVILILGCWFRPDGTLPPLLKGRVDAAIAFWREIKAHTGREALLIPSGGQGPDEPMPEAKAMARYLISQGIPAACVVPEKRSANTYENMAFSRELIEARQAGHRVAYATTNYHVFRSGLWANQAGMPAEGIGSRTKWWFWPNAFMRECLGLMLNRVRQEALLLAILAALFTGAALLLN